MRDYEDSQMREFLKAVRKRDKNVCGYCLKKKSPRALQVHHIQRWCDAPHLRYDVNNGIVLCRTPCHEFIKNKEIHYRSYFYEVIRQRNEKKGKK